MLHTYDTGQHRGRVVPDGVRGWLGCPDPAKPSVSFHIWGFSNNGQEKKKKKGTVRLATVMRVSSIFAQENDSLFLASSYLIISFLPPFLL